LKPTGAAVVKRFFRGVPGQLREKGDISSLRHDSDLRRYLHTCLFSAVYEEEDLDKGKAAALFLLDLGFDMSDLQEMMTFVDPLRDHTFRGDEELPEIRVLTDYDREIIRILLPLIVKSVSDDELCAFGKHIFIHEDINLGPLLYSKILLEIGNRGMYKELLLRYQILEDEKIGGRLEEIEFEAILRSLAEINSEPEPVEIFDEIRRFFMGVLYGKQNKE
jgi:hypothetical protein